MFFRSVLYLDNAEVPIFYKSVTLGTTFKSAVKKIYSSPEISNQFMSLLVI